VQFKKNCVGILFAFYLFIYLFIGVAFGNLALA